MRLGRVYIEGCVSGMQGVDIMRVKTQLLEAELALEEFGGDVPVGINWKCRLYLTYCFVFFLRIN